MYETIVVPTDASPTADKALEHAIGLAKRHEAVLKAVYVIDTSLTKQGPRSLWADWDEMAKHLHEDARKRLEGTLEPARGAAVKTEGAVRASDDVPEAILTFADEESADVIVMGTHGRSGVGRFLLGSVADRVSKAADRPVLLVPDERRVEP